MKQWMLVCCVLADVTFALDLTVRNQTLSDVVDAFSVETGWVVEVESGSNPRIRVDAENQTPLAVLDAIAAAAGLHREGERSPFRLVQPSNAQELASIELQHREVSQVMALLEGAALDGTGALTMIPDPDTNRLLMRGTPEAVARASALIALLDVEIAQILIEATLVSTNTSLTKRLGFRWSFDANQGRTRLNGQSSDANADGSGLSLAFISDRHLLALEVDALEAAGAGEVISEPRIVTTNRRPATIRQGQQVPFATLDDKGQRRIEFKDAVLELNVTPVLRDDGQIELTLRLRQDQVSALATEEGPLIETRELDTKVSVVPGDTLVLGGIYESKQEELVVGVPGLSAIPVMGRLFRSREHREFTSELLIFITPVML